MTSRQKALTPTEIATAQAIRAAFNALPSHPLKRWLPLRVASPDGCEVQMLGKIQKVRTDGLKDSSLHLLTIRSGRLLAGLALQPLVNTFTLQGDNRLVHTGGPSPVKPDQEAFLVWREAGFDYVEPSPDSNPGGYEHFKARSEAASQRCKDASEVLQRFPKGPMGLTPDDVKSTPEWRAARTQFDAAHADLRAANDALLKHFPEEVKADRDRQRALKMQAFGSAPCHA